MAGATSKLPPFTLLDEPFLAFAPQDAQLDIHPLRGLTKFGPFSKGSFAGYGYSIETERLKDANQSVKKLLADVGQRIRNK